MSKYKVKMLDGRSIREYSLNMDKKAKQKKLSKALSNYFANLGRLGSRARKNRLSARKRREIAKKAASARWSKVPKRRKPKR